MKKQLKNFSKIAVAAAIIFAFAACSSGVPQEKHDSALEKIELLETELAAANASIDSLKSEIEAAGKAAEIAQEEALRAAEEAANATTKTTKAPTKSVRDDLKKRDD